MRDFDLSRFTFLRFTPGGLYVQSLLPRRTCSPDQFIDRRRELRCITSRIVNHRQSTAVVGLLKDGVTTLIEATAKGAGEAMVKGG